MSGCGQDTINTENGNVVGLFEPIDFSFVDDHVPANRFQLPGRRRLYFYRVRGFRNRLAVQRPANLFSRRYFSFSCVPPTRRYFR